MPDSGPALPDIESLSDSESSSLFNSEPSSPNNGSLSNSEPSSPDDESSSGLDYYNPVEREPVEQLHKRFQRSTAMLRHLQYLDEGRPFMPLGSDIPKANFLLGRRSVVDASAAILELGYEDIAVASFTKKEQSQVVIGGLACVVSSVPIQDQMGKEMRTTKPCRLQADKENSNSDKVADSLGILYLVGGKNLWPQITNNNWLEIIQRYIHRSLSTPSNPNVILDDSAPVLPDHTETVAAYLNEYKISEDEKVLENFFFKYIIIACWKKMYLRIFSWSSVGLIYNLSKVSREALDLVGQRLKLERGGDRILDRGLSQQLAILHQRNEFVKIVSPNQCPSLPIPNVDALLSEANAYREDTVHHFHFLLTRVLLSFARALWRLAQAHHWSPKGFKTESSEYPDLSQTKDILTAVDEVIPIAYTLFIIANSNAQRTHLELINGLDAGFKLEVPTEDERSKYNEFIMCFVKDKDEMIEKRECSATAFLEAGGDDGVGESRPGFGQEGDSATVCPEAASDNGLGGEENGLGDEENKEGEEYATMARWAKTTNKTTAVIGAVFRKWISTFVSHFTAKRILEKEARRHPHAIIEFHIMAMSHTKEKSSSWEDMKGHIRQAVMCSGPFPSRARSLAELSIKKLEEIINHPNKQAFVPRASPQILKSNGLLDRAAEDSETAKSLKLRGCQHGEALLAMLMRIRRDQSEVRKVTQDTRLTDLIAVLDVEHIGTSRLCCPVCWDLLKELRFGFVDSPSFEVRGRHPIIYEVELPATLPRTTLQRMVRRYEYALFQELSTLVQSGR